MALSDPDDVCRLAYDGKLEELRAKCRENNDLLTKVDEVLTVKLMVYFKWVIMKPEGEKCDRVRGNSEKTVSGDGDRLSYQPFSA